MTSHDRSRGSGDLIDARIRWALRESVADATPPPDTWKQITERLALQDSGPRMTWWRELRAACTSVALWVYDSAVGPPVELVFCDSRELERGREAYHLRLLLYQNDLPTLLGQAV